IYWIKIYEHSSQTFSNGVKIKAAHDGFIIGSTSAGDHARMVKIDENGTLVWDKAFVWGGYESTCEAISSLEDGNFLFVGGYTDFYHYETAIIVKIDSSGELLWKKDYKPNYPDFVWEFRGVEQTRDKGFMLMGVKSWIWSGDGKEKGLWILKTD